MLLSTMQYKRTLSNKIILLSSQVPVIVLTGARQSGKTTLLKHLFPTYMYVSLDQDKRYRKTFKINKLF